MKIMYFFNRLSLVILVGSLVINFANADSMHNSTNTQRLLDHLNTLKSRLQIQSNQEEYWENYKNSIIDNEANNEKMLREESSKTKLNATDYFKFREKRVDSFAQSLHTITSNFEVLYEHLTPEQKQFADNYFKEITK